MKKYIRSHCPHCEKQVMAEKEIENAKFHSILTILTIGLWGIVFWLLQKGNEYRCRICKNIV